tara:strand:- start:9377 stop:10066 length:690 start_codon:yes stop_codon:yes gene_type:complete
MKNLLDLVQDYQSGGYVNPFDPSGQPTQEGVMSQYDIELTDDKYQPFLPTYDQTGEQFAIDNYILGREGLYSGAQDALSTAGIQEQQRQATAGFAGSGTNLLDTTRSDVVSQFGREGQRMFSGLQQDIYGQRRGFEDQLLSAIGDLDPEAYTIGENNNSGTDPDDFTSGVDDAVENAVSQALSNPPSGWTGGSNVAVGTTHTDEFGAQWQVVLNPPPASNPVWLLVDSG